MTGRARRIVVAITGATGAVYGVRLLQTLQTLSVPASPAAVSPAAGPPAAIPPAPVLPSAGNTPLQLEIHLVISDAAVLTLHEETGMARREVEALAHVVHKAHNVGASIASGSFLVDAMVIAPCSMKTLAAVAHGLADNLIARAADVMLKERRRLVLMVRETPFNLAHLRNMTAVTEMGGIVFPPLPAFYHRPQTIDDLVDHTVARVLDLIGLEGAMGSTPRWHGLSG